ncbi:LptF/LptG family permease [soil metagenome]
MMPFLIDRYVMRQFVTSLLFTIGALAFIYVVIDLLEHLDGFLDQHVPFTIIVSYYVVLVPSILKLLLPMGMLLACLFTVGRLSGNNETTAMRSSGQSLFRFMLPFLISATLISLGDVYFNGWVVPRANARKFQIERQYLNSTSGGTPLYNLYFRDVPLRNVSINFYDAERRSARDVVIHEFSDGQHPRISKSITSPEMVWDTVRTAWVVRTGTMRIFHGDTVSVTTLADATVDFTIRHDQIVRLQRNTDELDLSETLDYLETMRKGGKDTRRQEIDYFGQYAFPWASLIVVLVAVPFASVRRKGGIAVYIALAMLIAGAYIALTKIVQAAGATWDAPAEAVAWSVNVVFVLIGIGIVLRTRT